MTTGSPPPMFGFGQFRMRPTSERDRQLLEQAIAADPDHRGRVSSDFFLDHLPGEDGWAIENATGRVVFYLKTQVGCRLHSQFVSDATAEDREQNREALVQGLDWLEGQLGANEFREMIFSSVHPPLIAAAIRRMGFRRSPNELVRAIPARHAHATSMELPHPEPHMTQEEGA